MLLVLDGVELVDAGTEVCGVTTEGDAEVLEEAVHAGKEGLGGAGGAVAGRGAFEDDDAIGQVGGHDEVVLDDEGGLFGVEDEALDDLGSNDALLGIEIGRGLVDEVNVSGLAETEGDGHALELAPGQVAHGLVDDVVEAQGLDDVSLELGVQEHVADFVEEEVADRVFGLAKELLGLVGDVELGDEVVAWPGIGALDASEHADEGCFPRSVFPEHDDDFRVCELSWLYGEGECWGCRGCSGCGGCSGGGISSSSSNSTISTSTSTSTTSTINTSSHRHKGLHHVRILVAPHDIGLGTLLERLEHAKGEGLVAEAQVLGGQEAIEEDVDALAHGKGHGDDAVDAGHAVQAADKVAEVVKDAEVVLDDNDIGAGPQEGANGTCRHEALLDVQIGGGLIEHVHVCTQTAGHGNGKALQLAPGEGGHVALEHVLQVEDAHELGTASALVLLAQNVAHAPAHGLEQQLHKLRLDHGAQLVLQHARKVVLQLAAPEVRQHLLPLGRLCVSSQVRLLPSGQDLQCRGLANPVRPHQPQHLSRARHRQPVQLERVCPVPVRRVPLQVCWQVDDVDGPERALLDAHPAPYAQLLRYPRQRAFRRCLYAQLPHPVHRARPLALLLALFRLALVAVHYRYARQLLGHFLRVKGQPAVGRTAASIAHSCRGPLLKTFLLAPSTASQCPLPSSPSPESQTFAHCTLFSPALLHKHARPSCFQMPCQFLLLYAPTSVAQFLCSTNRLLLPAH